MDNTFPRYWLVLMIISSAFLLGAINSFQVVVSHVCLKPFLLPRQLSIRNGALIRHLTKLHIRPDWYKKAQDESMVIVKFSSGEDVRDKMAHALEQAGMTVSVDEIMLPTSPTIKKNRSSRRDQSTPKAHSAFMKRTLHEISRLYHFSMGYLGDYVCSLGIDPPLKIDVPIGEFMTGEQMLSLLTAVSTVAPHEANSRFSDGSCTLISLAKSLNVDIQYMMDLCGKMDVKVPLPFGKHTQIHSSLVHKIVEEIQGRKKYEGFETIPPFRKGAQAQSINEAAIIVEEETNDLDIDTPAQ